MAAKKAAKKTRKKSGERKGAPEKITLPAFGLAEEILELRNAECGMRNVESKATDREGGTRNEDESLDLRHQAGVQPEIRNPKSAIEKEGEYHLVTFNLDREEYGVEISSVQEIIRVGQITAVPNAPQFIKGVINLRGKVIPVLNLRKRLDLPDERLTKNSRIMVVESGRKIIGMLVDSVSQVLRIPMTSVDDPPSEVEQMKAYVRGIGKVDSRLIMIMDLNKALAKDAIAAGEATAR